MGTSIIMGTTDAGLLLVGAAATLLPDVDTSTSIAGRALFPISRELERRFPHRSCTHSLVASGIVAILFYPLALASYVPINLIHALNIGYFLGYFADIFTAAGCELFWPSTVRAVWPGNRNYRLRTNSPVEYGVLVVLSFLLALSIAINSNGGILTQFNRLIASTEGVEQIYNQSGATHLITVRIQGVFRKGRSRVTGEFFIVDSHGQGFLVLSPDGKLYKAGKEADCQIITEQITANVGEIAMTRFEALTLNDENLEASLRTFDRANTLTFVTGEITVDVPEDITFTDDLRQFPFIQLSGASVKLESAPLGFVIQVARNQFATGRLSIKSIIKDG
ncbi:MULTISPECIES: metal-dependent hydrolase [Nostocales]